MQIISLEFALFVLVSLIVYYLLPHRLQNLFLLGASYYFYSTWSVKFAQILVGFTLFNYLLALYLDKRKAGRGWAFWLGIAVNVGAFLLFLFGDFFGDSLTRLMDYLRGGEFEFAILLPLGFSYYVMECISYLIEVYRQQIKATTNLLNFALYLVYFPKLISGPIERARSFLPQINEERTVDNEVIARSVALILIGLVRGMVFAGLLMLITPQGLFTDPLDFSNLELVAGVLLYAFILYNQFAGYSNIVRGVSGFFGVELTRNFATPVFSQTFSEFWTRWHISLSQWLRDYIYLPLSRYFLRRNPRRDNKANLLIPPMATMLASGVWHGANLHLIVWGAINGVYAVGEQILALFRSTDPSRKKPFWRQSLSMLTVAALGFAAVIPFGLDLNMGKVYVYGILMQDRWTLPDLRFTLLVGATLLLDWLQYRSKDEFVFLSMPRWTQALLIALTLIAIFVVDTLQSALPTFTYP